MGAIWQLWPHRSYLRRSLYFPPTTASARCVHLISAFGILYSRSFCPQWKPHSGGKSIFRSLSIYPDLSEVEGAAREFDIRGNPDHPFTNINVVGGDFVIPGIYMIREARKSFT